MTSIARNGIREGGSVPVSGRHPRRKEEPSLLDSPPEIVLAWASPSSADGSLVGTLAPSCEKPVPRLLSFYLLLGLFFHALLNLRAALIQNTPPPGNPVNRGKVALTRIYERRGKDSNLHGR